MAFSSEQIDNARVIASVGRSVGASERDIQVALATAFQESGLRNLNYGDRDSLGLFQQRPSMGWGSKSQVANAEYAARAFFLGAGTNKGLLDYSQRDSWSVAQAAQKVQRSAFPDAYAKHESKASQLLAQIGGTGAPSAPVQGQGVPQDGVDPLAAPTGPSVGQKQMGEPALGVAAPGPLGVASADKPINFAPYMPQMDEDEFNSIISGVPAGGGQASGKAAAIIATAKQYLNTPYKWGGSGPGGFDCSGLLQFVFKKHGVDLPRVSFQQAKGGTQVGRGQAQAGDLWSIDNSSRNNGADHIALFLGGPKNQILEAPRAGLNVRIRSLTDEEMAKGGFTRYL